MYRLICRNCGLEIIANNLPELTGSYLVHSVKQHWNEIILLHNATDEEIAQAAVVAVMKGWI